MASLGMVLENKTRSLKENKVVMPTFVPWASEMSLRICDSIPIGRDEEMCFRDAYKLSILCSEALSKAPEY